MLSPAETRWLDRIESALADLPDTEGELLEQTQREYGHLFKRSSYGL